MAVCFGSFPVEWWSVVQSVLMHLLGPEATRCFCFSIHPAAAVSSDIINEHQPVPVGLHPVVNSLMLCWLSLFLIVILDTSMHISWSVFLICFTITKRFSFTIWRILLLSNTLVFCGLPGHQLFQCIRASCWFWRNSFFGYVSDWFIQIFQPNDDLLSWHWHLFGPHAERQQQQTPNADDNPRINCRPFSNPFMHIWFNTPVPETFEQPIGPLRLGGIMYKWLQFLHCSLNMDVKTRQNCTLTSLSFLFYFKCNVLESEAKQKKSVTVQKLMDCTVWF